MKHKQDEQNREMPEDFLDSRTSFDEPAQESAPKVERDDAQGEKKQNFLIQRTNKIKLSLRQRGEAAEARRAENDVIFREPLHPVPEEAPKPLVRGSVDMWFLLWAMLLVCFGAVMSYSASAVYAEQEYGSTTYFLWRYLIFTALAALVTVVVVIIARPWMWRVFAAAAYVGSISC